MSGDLGNLLTGEMGEAEARFAYDDFAEAYGGRIMGRVRTRRAVRVAGVGGGTAITAAALAMGATHMPWGVLGAAGGLGVGGSDCVTPSPSPVSSVRGATVWEAPVVPSSVHVGTVTLVPLDGEGGAQTMILDEADDGTLSLTIGSGESQVLVLDARGFATVEALNGKTFTIQVARSGESTEVSINQGDSFEYTSDADAQPGALVEASTTASSDDCVTPSPTPSSDPGLSATIISEPDTSPASRPEGIIGDSPFQCGFEFPSESLNTDALWIDGAQWMTGADAAAAIKARFADDPSQAPGIGNLDALVARVTVHFAGAETEGGFMGYFGTAEPSMGQIDKTRSIDTTDLYASEGATYVGVADGRVVATSAVPAGDGGMVPPVYLQPGPFPEDGSLAYLLDQRAALTSCDANPVDSESIDLFVVAGLIVLHADGTVDGPTYAWMPLGTA